MEARAGKYMNLIAVIAIRKTCFPYGIIIKLRFWITLIVLKLYTEIYNQRYRY